MRKNIFLRCTTQWKNRYLQVEKGNVHIVIAMDSYRRHFYDHSTCGVRLFVTDAGVLTFAKGIPVDMFGKVMMRYPVEDDFARTMRASWVQDPGDPSYGHDLSMEYKRGWFSVFSPSLAAESLPLCHHRGHQDPPDGHSQRPAPALVVQLRHPTKQPDDGTCPEK
jgi:hypothetical protein